MEALVTGLLKSGAPWGILCGVLIMAVVTLWRRTVLLGDQLYSLSKTYEDSMREHRNAQDNALRELDRVTQRFSTVQPPVIR